MPLPHLTNYPQHFFIFEMMLETLISVNKPELCHLSCKYNIYTLHIYDLTLCSVPYALFITYCCIHRLYLNGSNTVEMILQGSFSFKLTAIDYHYRSENFNYQCHLCICHLCICHLCICMPRVIIAHENGWGIKECVCLYLKN